MKYYVSKKKNKPKTGKTHTMLGPNPRKVANTPAQPNTSHGIPKTSMASAHVSDGGLMVKAMDEIFRYVEESDNSDLFKVMPMHSTLKHQCFLLSLRNKQLTAH